MKTLLFAGAAALAILTAPTALADEDSNEFLDQYQTWLETGQLPQEYPPYNPDPFRVPGLVGGAIGG